jgi:hypothetical protein
VSIVNKHDRLYLKPACGWPCEIMFFIHLEKISAFVFLLNPTRRISLALKIDDFLPNFSIANTV